MDLMQLNHTLYKMLRSLPPDSAVRVGPDSIDIVSVVPAVYRAVTIATWPTLATQVVIGYGLRQGAGYLYVWPAVELDGFVLAIA